MKITIKTEEEELVFLHNFGQTILSNHTVTTRKGTIFIDHKVEGLIQEKVDDIFKKIKHIKEKSIGKTGKI